MTDIVREAEELLAGVTPGEWKASNSNGIHVGYRCVATTDMEPREQRVKDAAFIAAAPRLIRSLLQRLRETEEDNNCWLKAAQETTKLLFGTATIGELSAHPLVALTHTKINGLRAENAKLRAAIKGETFYHSDEAANEEMNRLRAERDKLRKAMEDIKEHLRLPAEKRDDGVIYEIADNACDIARKALTRAGEE